MNEDKWCRQCFRDPAREDGFCSDYCADQYDRELSAIDLGDGELDLDDEEGGEA